VGAGEVTEERVTCPRCGFSFRPALKHEPGGGAYYECPYCWRRVPVSSPQFILPDIVTKTAAYMRAKYAPIPGYIAVHDLVRCTHKARMEQRYPELAEMVLFMPPVQIGEMVHSFVEAIPTIDRVQRVFKREADDYRIAGRPDISTPTAVYDLKFVSRLPREPLRHHAESAAIYAWLADVPAGYVVYFSPRGFREFGPIPPASAAFVAERAREFEEDAVHPRWGWECHYHRGFNEVCPYSLVRPRASASPQEAPPEIEYRWHSSDGRSKGGGQVVTCEVCGYVYTATPVEVMAGYSACPRCGFINPVGSNEATRGRPPKSRVLERLAAEHGIKYRLPDLPELEDNLPNRKWLAAAIDCDGWIGEHTLRKDKIDGWRYGYNSPAIVFRVMDKALTNEVARLEGTRAFRVAYDTRVLWEATVTGARAIAVLLLIHDFLKVPMKRERTEAYFKKYRERPSVRVW